MPHPTTHAFRREQIARAMLRLLARSGVTGATMRALAAETGLTQGVLHYHFASKHEMLLAALAEIERRIALRLRARGADDLNALIDALLEAAPDLPADTEALGAWIAIGDAARADERIRLAYSDTLARLHKLLAARLGDTPDAEALAAAALCQVEGAWRIGSLAPSTLPAGTAAHTLKRMLRATRGDDTVLAPTPAPPPRPDLPSPTTLRLRPRDRAWLDTLVQLAPFPLNAALWSVVTASYTAPGRHYHTLQHLAGMAKAWREVADGPGWQDPRASWLALLFHDIVYDPAARHGENEGRSAQMLAALIPDTEAACTLIRLTASHGDPDAPLLDPDAAHFLDCDVGILAAPPARFAEYEAQVTAEYAVVVPIEAYRVGRRAFVERMLALPRIFQSDFFHARLEAQARANLMNTLAKG